MQRDIEGVLISEEEIERLHLDHRLCCIFFICVLKKTKNFFMYAKYFIRRQTVPPIALNNLAQCFNTVIVSPTGSIIIFRRIGGIRHSRISVNDISLIIHLNLHYYFSVFVFHYLARFWIDFRNHIRHRVIVIYSLC